MATLLKDLYPGSKVYAFDTYEGMPETKKGVDLHIRGDFSDASLSEIKNAAARKGIDNIVFVKGDVRETLMPRDVPLGLAHVDLDIYEPIAFSQVILWRRLVAGGYIVYDDATTSSCLGATRAVEEFIAQGLHCEQIYPHFVFRKE